MEIVNEFAYKNNKKDINLYQFFTQELLGFSFPEGALWS